MAFVQIELSDSYWQSLEIDQGDIEFLYTTLLEKEEPLPSTQLAEALIRERIQKEKQRLQEKQQKNGAIYLPEKMYQVGEKIQFPAINWIAGEVTDVRKGNNPELPSLEVLTVELENGKTRQFAANIADHNLNTSTTPDVDDSQDDEQNATSRFGAEITAKLEEKLNENKDLVRIGAEWFPKSLLINFNVGHLNLAEAVLDMHAGGPLTVDELLSQIEVETDDPAELVRFSMNYALQEDGRFDEVGPYGEVQWFLNRLEPKYVREIPLQLQYQPIDYDREVLTEDMLNAERRLADELTPDTEISDQDVGKEVTIALTYPHWRVGSLPLTPQTRPFFPTAIDTPRVKFSVYDDDNEEISAWVVRPFNYVYGLQKWYEEKELMPGSLLRISKGKNPGEIRISPVKKRTNREWIKTLLIGADGGIVFAMLKQTITADFNERMAIAVPSTDVLDGLWEKRAQSHRPLAVDMIELTRELAKLNPQGGQVHAIELYAAVNCVRRCPPGKIFSILETDPHFSPIGDLYYHLNEMA